MLFLWPIGIGAGKIARGGRLLRRRIIGLLSYAVVGVLKYACYIKVKVLLIDHTMPQQLFPQETRWKVMDDYDDKILRMG